jgi:putative transposase
MSKKTDDFDLPNPSFEPMRQRVDIQVDRFVKSGDRVYRIIQVLDFDSVIGVDVNTGRSVPLRVGDLRLVQDVESPPKISHPDLAEIADSDWKISETRFAAIKPLIHSGMIGRNDVKYRANEVGVSVATLYRWLKRYTAYGVVSALIPQKRGWREGNGRLPVFSAKVIEEVINDFYLTPQKPSIQKTVTEVLRICNERGIDAPSPTGIRARIGKVSERRSLRGRGYKEKAKNKFLPVAGKFPNADYPLSVVQIDHTPANITLVDDKYRKAIGRPWITLAMDVYSRMVMWYYLSFDPPSETSVAMCVAHAVLPKDEWLLLHNVDAKWPVWGIPRTIHVDNGAEFRSNNFQQSCLMYGINLEFRPVKQPRYGGHIERMLGTLLREMHAIPGTTFSSVQDKGEYDSEKHATMTKSEFEAWLVTLICKVYHQRLHTGIGTSPLRRWDIGIFGNAEVQGCGLPARPADRHTVLLDMLPSFRRTVQAFGVTIDGLAYYAEALRPWINANLPDSPKEKREFIFRRDPRDISSIWFYDPVIKHYFKIPFADQSLPTLSIWEYQQARERLKRDGLHGINEAQILRAVTELRTQVENSEEKTKKARRMSQRRKEHEKRISPANPLPARMVESTQQATGDALVDGDIDSFGEIA